MDYIPKNYHKKKPPSDEGGFLKIFLFLKNKKTECS